MTTIPEAVRRAALYFASDLPDRPPGHPYTQVRRDGYTISFRAGQSWGSVVTESIDDVDAAVADAREVLQRAGVLRAAWLVSEATTPHGLNARLLERGFTVWDEPPFEPRSAAMATVDEPPPSPGIEVRLPETFEEFRAASRVAEEAFELPEETRAENRALEKTRWEMEQRYPDFRTYVALLGGEIVAGAAISYGRNAAFLAGGYTRPDVRGRGVYRALVRARWDAAVEHGTPALTVGAGKMSRPILERLGFQIVGWVDALRDTF